VDLASGLKKSLAGQNAAIASPCQQALAVFTHTCLPAVRKNQLQIQLLDSEKLNAVEAALIRTATR
jgi:hypothetical protein